MKMVFFENGDLIGSKKIEASKNCPDWTQKWKKEKKNEKGKVKEIYCNLETEKKKKEKKRDWK